MTPLLYLKRMLQVSVDNPIKRCPHCENLFPRTAEVPSYWKRRKFCSRRCAWGHQKEQTMKDRDDLIHEIDAGLTTLDGAGKKYGISRERVRQIYKKATGKGARNRIKAMAEVKEYEKGLRDLEVKVVCERCGTIVLRGEARTKGGGFKYCRDCRELQIYAQRDIRTTFWCETCKEDFHPPRNWRVPKQRAKGRFCSMACYMKSYTFKHKNRGVQFTTEQLSKALRSYALSLGREPTCLEWAKHKQIQQDKVANYETYHKRFGSWVKAKVAAGIIEPDSYTYKPSPEQL